MKLRDLRTRAEHLVRRSWMRLTLRGTTGGGALGRFDLAYKLRDPWKMDSEPERFRFKQSNRLLQRALIAPAPRVGSILEIGCGEGHQSAHLIDLCDSLTGIDVSPTAVERARRRVPSGQFLSGDLFAHPWIDEVGKFDVVTAFEVLYYPKDVLKTLQAMSKIGKTCFVSYFAPTAHVVEAPLMQMPIAGRDSFGFGDLEWRVAWWRNPS